MNKVKRCSLILFMGSFLVLIAGCAGSSQDNARFRVVHTSPDTSALAVRFNVEVAINSLTYKSASSYVKMLSGGHTLHVVNAATPLGTPRISRNLEFRGGDQTALVVGGSANLDILLVPDSNAASTTPGNARLRLVHAASELAAVDVYVTDPAASLSTSSPNVTSLAFKGTSPYLEFPEGNYRVRVTPAGSKSVSSDSGTLSLTKGHVYSSVLVGGLGAPLQSVTLTDL